MLAMNYRGPLRVHIDHKPEIQHPQDAIVRVARSCIWGSDLHLYNGSVPDTRVGIWLPLMLADRVGVVEGYVEDMARGHVPNVFAERGWKAEWKHNRKSLVTRVAVGAVLAGVAVAYLRSGKDKRDRKPTR